MNTLGRTKARSGFLLTTWVAWRQWKIIDSNLRILQKGITVVITTSRSVHQRVIIHSPTSHHWLQFLAAKNRVVHIATDIQFLKVVAKIFQTHPKRKEQGKKWRLVLVCISNKKTKFLLAERLLTKTLHHQTWQAPGSCDLLQSVAATLQNWKQVNYKQIKSLWLPGCQKMPDAWGLGLPCFNLAGLQTPCLTRAQRSLCYLTASWRSRGIGLGELQIWRGRDESEMPLTFHSRGHSILVFPTGFSGEPYTASQHWRLPRVFLRGGACEYQSWCRYGPSVVPSLFQLLVLPDWETGSKERYIRA